jgi:HAE1 family hydrophobic/amphiphilic exporter-1
MQLQDTTGGKYTFQDFQANAQEILKVANENPVYGGRAYTLFSASTPQFEINFDRDQLNRLNVDFDQALSVLSASIGSAFVNQFVYGSRYYQVYVQFDGEFRNQPQDLKQIYVRSRTGNMVSMDQVVSIKPFTGPANITHFNEYRSILLQGNPAPGFSSGQGLTALEAAYNKAHLPGISFSWSDLSREEVSSAGLAPLIFLFGIIMVFLVLSAQYESYIDPTIIMLTVPLAILGALLTTSLRGLVNNVYCNIALVMLIGLASKNAILIVEFANQLRAEGLSITKAAIEASQERLRPILMTAISTLVGIFPLVVATGAGAGSRQSLGTAVFGGMLVATCLTLFMVPILYIVIVGVSDRISRRVPHPEPDPEANLPLPESQHHL